MITLLTFVSYRKVRTAGVARSSWKSSLTEGARGCFHSQAFPTLFHSSSIWGDQARQLTKRWRRDSTRLVGSFHSSRPGLYEPIAACPEASRKKRPATPSSPSVGPGGYRCPSMAGTVPTARESVV